MRLILSLLILTAAALHARPAEAACDCKYVSGPLAFAGWGVVINKELLSKKKREFMIVRPLKVLLDAHGVGRDFVEFRPPYGCHLPFEKGDLVFVRGFGSSYSKFYGTAECVGTRKLGSPPPVSLAAKAPSPLESHPLLEPARAVFEEALNKCTTSKKDFVETVEIVLYPGEEPVFRGASECVRGVVAEGAKDWTVRQAVGVTGVVVNGQHSASGAEMWECSDDHPCKSSADVVIEALSTFRPIPKPEDARPLAKYMAGTQLDAVLDAAGLLCPSEGYEAASQFADEHKLLGGDRYEEMLREAMLGCAVARREIPRIRQYAAGAPVVGLLEDIFTWEKTALMTESGVREPIRSGKAQPIGSTPVREFRAQLVTLPRWGEDLTLLQAFAQSVAAEDSPRPRTRFVGALAYQKAALMHPDPKAQAQLRAWADKLDPAAATSEELQAMTLEYTRAKRELAELVERAKAQPEVKDPVAQQETAPSVQAPPEVDATASTKKPMWQTVLEMVLAVGGGVGVGLWIVKRRK